MNEEDKKEFLDDFKKADGEKKLDMWYYALDQEVLWDQMLADMSVIAREQKMDKKLDKAMQEEMKKTAGQ
ncbi:MAG: hypothetical protein U9R21_05915 [Candidatus Thermoplasmatota archaeon]|nr:hypothetical protein [Candidatus Thermoplasmatota archaeon]